jgi:hypothetical protein
MGKKKRLTVTELGNKYKDFIKGKELNDNSKELFEKTLSNAVKPKQQKKDKL